MSMNDHGKEVNLDDVLIGDRRKDFYCEGMKNDGEYLRHAVKSFISPEQPRLYARMTGLREILFIAVMNLEYQSQTIC